MTILNTINENPMTVDDILRDIQQYVSKVKKLNLNKSSISNTGEYLNILNNLYVLLKRSQTQNIFNLDEYIKIIDELINFLAAYVKKIKNNEELNNEQIKKITICIKKTNELFDLFITFRSISSQYDNYNLDVSDELINTLLHEIKLITDNLKNIFNDDLSHSSSTITTNSWIATYQKQSTIKKFLNSIKNYYSYR
jgi:hypothetical protein